jgi:hypothetical protein
LVTKEADLSTNQAGVEQRLFGGRIERSCQRDRTGGSAYRRGEAHLGKRPEALLRFMKGFNVRSVEVMSGIAGMIITI